MTALSTLLRPIKKHIANICLLQFKSFLLGIRKSVSASKLHLAVFTLAASCLSFNAWSADNIIAEGDFETGDASQWRTFLGRDKQQQFQIVTSPVRQGKYAAEFIVRPGDEHGKTSGERSEVSTLMALKPRHGRTDKDGNGDEFYYAWSTLFPGTFPPATDWLPSFMNWHSSQGGTIAPLSFKIDPDNMNIIVLRAGGKCSARNCSDRGKDYTVVKHASKGVWNDFVVRAKWSCSDDGFIEVWHKYENQKSYDKVLSVHNITTLQSSQYWGNCMNLFKKQGFYRSDTKATHIVYQDGFTQGTSFEAVTRHAHGIAATQSSDKGSDKSSELPPPSNFKVVSITSKDKSVNTASGSISQSDWKLVYVDSEERDFRGTNAFDGDPNTLWHTEWRNRGPRCPHEIQIDLGKAYKISGFRYQPRQDGDEDNGRIKDYEFYVSDDGSKWGKPVASGSFSNSAAEREVVLRTPVTGRFIRLVALDEVEGGPWTSIAELNVMGSISNQ